MSEQQASVVVNAPVEQVYALFSHFNDFPQVHALRQRSDLR
jgi:uncharacterized membrane protein